MVPGTLVQQQDGSYTRSCGVGTTRVWYVYSFALECSARGMCSSCVLVWLCGERADDALPSLVARLLLLLCRPEGILLCTYGVDTAVCGQRADALPSLVARSHALAHLWCWNSSMVSITAPALSPWKHMLLCTHRSAIARRALACPCVLTCGVGSSMVPMLAPAAYVYLWCWYSSIVSILAPALSP